jgi:hypothetical protein
MSSTTFAYDSAAIAAACSCDVQTYSMSAHVPSESFECMAPPPVSMKTCLTP